ncbi:MAG: PAS domain-containing protein [Vicinamibacterales bacterium]
MAGRAGFVLEALHWAGVSALFAVGLTSLVGWMTGSHELIRLHASFAPAQLATSLSLMLLAVALILSVQGPRRAARSVAAVPLTLGGLALLSAAFSLPPALDRVLATALGAANADLVRSMAPSFAVGVVSAAAGVFVLTSPGSRRLAIGLTVPMVVVSLPVLAGYSRGGGTPVESWDEGTGFAVQTGVALLGGALSLGSLSLAPTARESRRWIWMPIAIAVLMASPIVLMWEQAVSGGDRSSGLPQTVLTIGILAAAALGFALSSWRSDLGWTSTAAMQRSASRAPVDAPPGRENLAPAAEDDLFRALAAVAPAGIYVTDVRGRYLFVNEQWCRMAGVSSEEASGEGWRRSLHTDDRQRVLGHWEASALAHERFDQAYRFQSPHGAVSWVEDRAVPLTHDDGRLAGYVGVVVDVSARRQTQLAVGDHEESWRLAVDAQHVGVFEWNLETSAIAWSARAYELLGFTSGERLPASFHALAHPEDCARLERALTQHLTSGTPLRLMLRLRRGTGGFAYFVFAGQAARDDRGRPSRLCGSILELSDELLAGTRH